MNNKKGINVENLPYPVAEDVGRTGEEMVGVCGMGTEGTADVSRSKAERRIGVEVK